MALTRRTLAATLAALALTGVAAQPARAYWGSNGGGTGTVPTAAAAAGALTLQLTATGTGHAVRATGKAGNGSPYQATITVYLCKSSPCSAANAAATLTATQSGGTYSVVSGNLNSWAIVHGQAAQSQNSGWRDYATAPAAVSNP